jgi:ribose transport system substrate-binding protein
MVFANGAKENAAAGGPAVKSTEPIRIVIVPKVTHVWFDGFQKLARQMAAALTDTIGQKVEIEYRPPAQADVALQNQILEQVAATHPAGIAIDLLDYNGIATTIDKIRHMGIAVCFFDAEAPDNTGITQIGSPADVQAVTAANALIKALGGKNATGKVAIMQGSPTAPNHQQRYLTYFSYLKKEAPGLTLIKGGVDNDNIEQAHQQAAATIAQNPDLVGYVGSDAGYCIGIADAAREAGKKPGQIKIVGMENLDRTLQYIKDGEVVASANAPAPIQAAYTVLCLVMQHFGYVTPARINTGIQLITKDNVDDFINLAKQPSVKDFFLKAYGWKM